MSGGDHHHHRKDGGMPLPPKGFVAIRVGVEREENQQRFVLPVAYLNHPLFRGLLKEAEEEYGFEQEGPIVIPCYVHHFQQVRGIIDHDYAPTSEPGGCFRA